MEIMNIGKRIRLLRDSLRYSFRQFSDITGVPVDTLRKLERCHILPDLCVLNLIAEKFNIPIAMLFSDCDIGFYNLANNLNRLEANDLSKVSMYVNSLKSKYDDTIMTIDTMFYYKGFTSVVEYSFDSDCYKCEFCHDDEVIPITSKCLIDLESKYIEIIDYKLNTLSNNSVASITPYNLLSDDNNQIYPATYYKTTDGYNLYFCDIDEVDECFADKLDNLFIHAKDVLYNYLYRVIKEGKNIPKASDAGDIVRTIYEETILMSVCVK